MIELDFYNGFRIWHDELYGKLKLRNGSEEVLFIDIKFGNQTHSYRMDIETDEELTLPDLHGGALHVNLEITCKKPLGEFLEQSFMGILPEGILEKAPSLAEDFRKTEEETGRKVRVRHTQRISFTLRPNRSKS